MPNFKAADFVAPEGVKPGEDFDALGTFVLQKDGSITIKAIEGASIAGYEDDKDEDEGFMGRYQGKMKEEMPPPEQPMMGG